MKYLDERITFEILVSSSESELPEKGVYSYIVMAADNDSYAKEHEVFVGNFYYNKTFRHTLDVTDIIRNAKPSYKGLALDLHIPSGADRVNIGGPSLTEYWIVLKMQKNGSTLTVTSDHQLVANVFRYPNRSTYAILDGSAQFMNFNLSAFNNAYYPLLMGYKYNRYSTGNSDKFMLIPRYPCKATKNYANAVTFGFGNNVQEIELYMSDQVGDYDGSKNIYPNDAHTDPYNGIWVTALGELLEDYMYEIEEYGAAFTDLDLYYKDRYNNYIQIGIFEACYSRYYLQWVDRFGFVQSQPFKDNITYSEDFETDEIITYDDKRRINNIQVQPKWKLNSGWIKDSVYPFYESIFTSPFLILYDSETDMNYEVIVKGNYVEKNYKNQKGLLKLELNLESAETQNIVY